MQQDSRHSTSCSRPSKSAHDAPLDLYTRNRRRHLLVAITSLISGTASDVISREEGSQEGRARWSDLHTRFQYGDSNTGQRLVSRRKGRTVSNYQGELTYYLLELEAEKRRQRREIELLMIDFFERGGKVQVFTVKPIPQTTKFFNRKQKKNVSKF
jgi:hypothetical protein